jgi:hypothetical protein
MSFVFVFLSNYIFAQTEPVPSNFQIGAGIRFSPFDAAAPTSSSNIYSSRLILPINIGSNFRVEPELGYRNDKEENQSETTKISTFSFGIGVFGIKKIQNVNAYGGIRLDMTNSTQTNQSSSNNNYTTTNKLKSFGVGPSIGVEYIFGRQFVLGGEFWFPFGSNDETYTSSISSSSRKSTNKFSAIIPSLVFRFFFN